MADEKHVKTLTLIFPEGVTVKTCNYIAKLGQFATGYGITQGGFAPIETDTGPAHADDLMYFTYGEKRKAKK